MGTRRPHSESGGRPSSLSCAKASSRPIILHTRYTHRTATWRHAAEIARCVKMVEVLVQVPDLCRILRSGVLRVCQSGNPSAEFCDLNFESLQSPARPGRGPAAAALAGQRPPYAVVNRPLPTRSPGQHLSGLTPGWRAVSGAHQNGGRNGVHISFVQSRSVVLSFVTTVGR